MTLLDVMPRLVPKAKGTADHAVAEAARVSFDVFEPMEKDERLIRYLIRSGHTSPLEMVSFKFDCKMPIYVARQWGRNRTAKLNEVSGRYVVLPSDQFQEFRPEQVRRQSQSNKQGSAGPLGGDEAKEFADRSRAGPIVAHEFYRAHLAAGVAKEQARTQLPLSTYTRWVWKIDLHNLLWHFCAPRCDSHAQEEIRLYANAILNLIQPIVPQVVKAWNDYHYLRDGLLLSRAEVEYIRRLLSGTASARIEGLADTEQLEWMAKAARLGMAGAE